MENALLAILNVDESAPRGAGSAPVPASRIGRYFSIARGLGRVDQYDRAAIVFDQT
tara:strand:- start:21 stop:188 length:168 start_codon:yes stop_codon:yes gene_type:complete